MNVTLDFVGCSLDELKALLAGGTLTVYSVARPLTADQPVERSGTLATFTFATPAFKPETDRAENPVFAANPVVAMHDGKPTLMVQIGNGRAAVLADAKAQLNVLLTETTTEGKVFHRAQELQLERAHIPIFPLFWTLMHVLDERSPLNGYDAARAVKANAQVFVAIEARDPTLATTVHDIRNYPAEDIRFGMRYTEAVTTARDGTPVMDLATFGALEPDVGDRQEQGWTEREEIV